MDDAETKFSMTITEADAEWLLENYPGGTSQQERLRMALSDARRFRERL